MIRAHRAHLHVTAVTHPGMTGKNNEDNYGVSAYQLSETDSTPVLCAIVSDGIGGHKAGEVASEIVVNTISLRVSESDGSDPQAVLKAAFEEANQKLLEEAHSNPDRHGMGATFSCAWIIGRKLYTATAGDSRIYMVRGNTIRQISVDHTWVQEAIEKGIIEPKVARTHPNAHVIRRYVGSEKHFEPDFRLRMSDGESDERSLANQGMPLMPGDIVFLCSDGLTDLINDDEILAAMQEKNGMKAASKSLVALANERGGHDNITSVLVMMPWDAEKRAWWTV